MQKIIIDCQTKQATYVELPIEEEATRLQESKQGQEELKKQLKRQLIMALSELREMKQERDFFTAEDLAEKQAEIDRIKNEL